MVKLIVFIILSLSIVLSSFSQENQPVKDLPNVNNILKQPSETIKLKELAEIQPTNSSILTGIGIVAGLTGKGDSLKKGKEIINKLFTQTGTNEIEIDVANIESKNIALVSVALKINGNMIKGTNLNVHVASILDSKDLTNGILLRTELKDNAGKVIATAAGPITTHKNSKGSGYILKGATVHENRDYSQYNIILKKKDYTIADAISKKLRQKNIKNNIKSENIIEIEIEEIGLLSEIEQIEIEATPKILINETNKIILASKDAEIGPLVLLIERNDNLDNKNSHKVKVEIQKMNLNEFISKNSETLTSEELITIIKKSKKINKLNGELILEE